MNKLILTATLSALFLASCAENDLGSGVNTINREYAKPATEVWSASMKAVDTAGLTFHCDGHDHMGGEISAHRANGDDVRIVVKSLSENTCRVSVRVQPGDRNLATMLQERIAEKAGLGVAKSVFFGGNTTETVANADLPSSVLSARRTFAALGVTATTDETHADAVVLDGRLKDSTPVRIKMATEPEQKTRVTFIAGNEKSADNLEFARKMKEEFEKLPSLKAGGN